MPKKSILISSGSAKRWAIPSNKFTYDTDTGYVSIDSLSSSQLTITGAINSVLVSSGGVIAAYKAEGNSGSYLVSDGTKWTAGSAGNVSIGPVSGTLTGSYPNPKFIDITYVESGSLPVARGGLSGSGNYNLLTAIPSGSLILASGIGSLTVVSTASYSQTGDAWVLASVSGTTQWAAVTASAPERDANVQFFTCSNPLTSSTNQIWTKMNPNHQWARVMLQGGGGGGGGAVSSSLTNGCVGGSGGGFTDIVVYVGNILSASIVVGAGGLGGRIATNTGSNLSPGLSGVSSSFSASGIFVSAGSGSGGVANSNTNSSDGGIGLTYVGGIGGLGANSAILNIGGSSSGAAGGGGGGIGAVFAGSGGTSGMYTTEVTGGIGGNYYTLGSTQGASGSSLVNLYGYQLPFSFGSGGGGGGAVSGTSSSYGGNGIFGSGGGGGGRTATSAGFSYGGNGGDGWVVVISY